MPTSSSDLSRPPENSEATVRQAPRTSALREIAQLGPPLIAAAVLLEIATGWGAGHRELLLAALTVGLTQVLPGALVWRLIRPRDGWLLEDVFVGFAIGAAGTVPVQVLSVILGLPLVDVIVPLLLTAGLLVAPATRDRIRSRRLLPLPWAWAFATTAACIPPALSVLDVFREPVRWQGWAVQYPDAPYHQALVGEALHRFPLHYPQVALEPLNYHWFTHAWTAQVASVSGTPIEVLLWRFNPSLMVVAIPMLVALVTVRVTRIAWCGPVAAAVAFVALDVTAWGGSPLGSPLHSPFSPTQQFGLLILLPVVTLIAMRWRDQVHRMTSLPVLVFLLVIAGGSKGSTMPVLVAGLLLATASALLLDRRRLPMVALDTALAILVSLALSLTLFGGGTGNARLAFPLVFAEQRGLGPDSSASGGIGVLNVALVLTPMLLGGAASLVLFLRRDSRRDPVAWMLLGGTVSGFCAILFLTHPGESQWYFYRTAEALTAILTAWGLRVALAGIPRKVAVIVAGLASGVVALSVCRLVVGRASGDEVSVAAGGAALAIFVGIVLVTAAIGSRWFSGATRQAFIAIAVLATVGAGLVPLAEDLRDWSPAGARVGVGPLPTAVHSSEVEALRWLRDHSAADDIVMTNLHCEGAVRDGCPRRRFTVAAYSERGVLVEGWGYTRGAGRTYARLLDEGREANYSTVPFQDPDLLALNDGFLTRPDAQSAARLWRLGVRWIVLYDRAPHAGSLAPFVRERVRTPSLTVLELLPPA